MEDLTEDLGGELGHNVKVKGKKDQGMKKINMARCGNIKKLHKRIVGFRKSIKK